MVETDWSTPSKSVEGSPVYKRDGERLGTIDHIMLAALDPEPVSDPLAITTARTQSEQYRRFERSLRLDATHLP